VDKATASSPADAARVWSDALETIRTRLPASSFEMWFADVRPRPGEGGGLELVVASDYIRSWLSAHYTGLIGQALTGAAGSPVKVRFVTEERSPDESESSPAPEVAEPAGPKEIQPEEVRPESPFPGEYSFDTFVLGPSNRFAHAAAMAVAEAPPSKAYNPLFIYGGVGLGKTHLLFAIAEHMARLDPKVRAKYVTSEAFVTEFIRSVREGQGYLFQLRYRDQDVLLVDDVQFLARAEETQTEFFHTFNTLHAAGRQIVIASDRPPQELGGIEERLRSRFRSGLVVDIQPPNLETRIAILQAKALRDRLAVPDDVLHFIAQKFDANVRELEGALIRVVARATLSDLRIDLALAERALEDLLPPGGEVPAELIMGETASYFGLRREDLVSKSRSRPLTTARHVAMYLLRELTGLSLIKIGDLFDRDHTTALHGIHRIEKLMPQRDTTYRQVQELTKVIQTKVRGSR
jgi:chromosomal replication initiator protein